MNKLLIAILFPPLMLTLSCAPRIKLKVDNTMIRGNPIKEISIVADGRVTRPRGMGTKPLLSEGKKMLDQVIPKIKNGFQQKGYKVSYAEPVGMGLGYNPSLYKEEMIKRLGKPRNNNQEEEQYEAYLYPAAQSNFEFGTAIRNIFEPGKEFTGYQFGDPSKQKPLFLPVITNIPEESVAVIQDVVGGDTICFTRIYGQKAAPKSTGQIIAASLLTISVMGIPGAFGVLDNGEDALVCHFTCVDAKDGKILLQYGVQAREDPLDPSNRYIEKVMEYFPEIDKPVDSKYLK